MYANLKCYFHPKDDSTDSCKGCKLPLCVTCHGWEGFCRECVEKRRAVHQLKQLRTVAASKAHLAATTTGRLRLAMHEAGPQAARRGPGPLQMPPTAPLNHTRPLSALSPSRMLPQEPAPQPRRAGQIDVAYKPATVRAADNRHGVKTPAKAPAKSPIKANAIKARPANQASGAAGLPAWSVPFIAGLAAGMVIVMLVMGTNLFHRAKPKAKPLYQGLTQQERQLARELLGKDAAPTIALSDGERATDTPQVGWTGH